MTAIRTEKSATFESKVVERYTYVFKESVNVVIVRRPAWSTYHHQLIFNLKMEKFCYSNFFIRIL